jgi:hypothetical protein
MKRTDSYLNNDFDFNVGGLTVLGLISLIIVILFIAPWLSFWLAYFGGWVAKVTIGNYIVRALELIGILITKDQIPLLAGGLGWIGGFFKTISTTKKGK